MTTICAVLEEKGYRRDDIRRLDRWYVNDVLCHPRDGRGQIDLRAHKKQTTEKDPLETWRALYRSRGWPEWRIEAKAQEFLRRSNG